MKTKFSSRDKRALRAVRGKDAQLSHRPLHSRVPHGVCARIVSRAGRDAARRGRGWWASLIAALWIFTATPRQADAQIEFPRPDVQQPIVIAADSSTRWQQGAYEVWVLRGRCSVSQGQLYLRGNEAVLWIERPAMGAAEPTKIIAYCEGNVQANYQQDAAQTQVPGGWRAQAQLTDATWFGRFYTVAPLQFRLPQPEAEPRAKPGIFSRGMARLDPNFGQSVRQVQHTEVRLAPETVAASPTDPVPPGVRRLRAFPRSDVRVQAQWFPSAGGQEWVAVISSGVNLIIDGLPDGRSIDISTDRMVVWTAGLQPDLNGQTQQRDDTPLEIYMEGNIVFREGERVIQADRMFYDVNRRTGIVLNAEVLTPMPGYEGLIKLKSSIVRQLDAEHFVAEDATLTTSRLGKPGYNLFANTINFSDQQTPVVDALTGEPQLDPETGEPIVVHQKLADARNNFVFVEGIPVFYWPVIATDLEDPSFYIDSVTVKFDKIFGDQVLTQLDAYEVLGIRNKPKGTNWKFDVDYLSKRGLAAGTDFSYSRSEFLGLTGATYGKIDAWGLRDKGLDNLGSGRRQLPLETENRGRVIWNHRQRLTNGYTLTAELGLVSDTNFLEQYFEKDWDTHKDYTTGLELKQMVDNMSWSITADARVNDFVTQTEWLPRLDHFWLGQSLFGDTISWFEHSSASYARMRAAEPNTPTPAPAGNPGDPFDPLPWEANVEGERFTTRQEIDLPLQLGPVKVVPFALGELAHWGSDLQGDDLQRAYVNTGVRASIPFWSVDPNIESDLLNVHGLAHKVTLEGELSYSDASVDVDQLPLYEQIDDDSQEAFRRRFPVTTFGLPLGVDVPEQFDSRNYAVRYGLQEYVTSPSSEIADDMTAMRMGLRQRWQTKRGPAGQRRIVDWITLDTHATWFPKDQQDNFGTPFGLVDYDFKWHVGDRFTLLSDGYFDFFTNGLKMVTMGGQLARERGSIYLGYRSLDGPFQSDVILFRTSYWLGPKWITSFATSVDLANPNNVGQNFSLTRVGESLLVRLGFVVNESKDYFSYTIMVEPRFLPRGQRGSLVGVNVPPAGAFGLE